MSFLPSAAGAAVKTHMLRAFGGYEHTPRTSDGAWYDMKNLTSDLAPLLSPREPRSEYVSGLTAPAGLIGRDCPVWVDGATLYINGAATGLNTLAVPNVTRADIAPENPIVGDYWYDGAVTRRYESSAWVERPYPVKQLVSMGAYICVFPDKMYINTANLSDFGSMEAYFSAAGAANISYSLCRADGTALDIGGAAASDTAPEEPSDGDYWPDSSGGGLVLRRWAATTGVWISVDAHVRIGCTGIGASFAKYDGVTLAGCSVTGSESERIAKLNGNHYITALGTDWIVIPGLILASASQTGGITLLRSVPELDFVCESGNRLWGCRYGIENGTPVNEIRASALGDFRNWNRYMGLSTDSWTASVGTDGAFTGAVSYLGEPTFFKENCLHRVTISASGAHGLSQSECAGVQPGSHNSLAVVGSTLYYKSTAGICAYQGGLPTDISADFGGVRYSDATAAARDSKYYVCMRNGDRWSLFVLDTRRGVWHREDCIHAVGMAQCGACFFLMDAKNGKIFDAAGIRGTSEGKVSWSAESGLLHLDWPGHKRVTRLKLRLGMESGAEAAVWLRYDSEGSWVSAGAVEVDTIGTVTLPIRPRRCDHFQLKIVGRGRVRLYSIAHQIEEGSDRP